MKQTNLCFLYFTVHEAHKSIKTLLDILFVHLQKGRVLSCYVRSCDVSVTNNKYWLGYIKSYGKYKVNTKGHYWSLVAKWAKLDFISCT